MEQLSVYSINGGMSFISNRWVYCGPQSYQVWVNEAGKYGIYSCSVAGKRLLWPGFILDTREEAEEMCKRLIGAIN